MAPPLSTAPPLSESDLARLERVARRIRCRVLAHVLANNGGYMSQACSSAELLAALYCRVESLGVLEAPLLPRPFSGVPGASFRAYTTGAEFHGPPSPEGDRLILSPAHYALAIYAALIEVGRLAEGALDQFNQDGSTTWEALAALAFHRLDTVRVVVDVNAQQCDGPMESVMQIEPLARRVEAFGASAAPGRPGAERPQVAGLARVGRVSRRDGGCWRRTGRVRSLVCRTRQR